MAEEEKVPQKQCEEAAVAKTRPRQRGQDVLPGILGKQLRAAYSELLSAPVPESITNLVKRLESQEAEQSKAPQKQGEE